MVLIVVVLILFAGLLLLPATQTFIGQRITENLTTRFGTKISVDDVQISPFGYVTLENVLAIDHRQDTLIFVGNARMSALRLRAVLQGENKLGDVMLRDVNANILTYKDENESNINLFFSRFEKDDEENKTTSPLHISSINLINGNLTTQNQNKIARDPIQFSDINATIDDFVIDNKSIKVEIKKLSADTSLYGPRLENISGEYFFLPPRCIFEMHLPLLLLVLLLLI